MKTALDSLAIALGKGLLLLFLSMNWTEAPAAMTDQKLAEATYKGLLGLAEREGQGGKMALFRRAVLAERNLVVGSVGKDGRTMFRFGNVSIGGGATGVVLSIALQSGPKTAPFLPILTLITPDEYSATSAEVKMLTTAGKPFLRLERPLFMSFGKEGGSSGGVFFLPSDSSGNNQGLQIWFSTAMRDDLRLEISDPQGGPGKTVTLKPSPAEINTLRQLLFDWAALWAYKTGALTGR